jgi:hypothetical protein
MAKVQSRHANASAAVLSLLFKVKLLSVFSVIAQYAKYSILQLTVVLAFFYQKTLACPRFVGYNWSFLPPYTPYLFHILQYICPWNFWILVKASSAHFFIIFFMCVPRWREIEIFQPRPVLGQFAAKTGPLEVKSVETARWF